MGLEVKLMGADGAVQTIKTDAQGDFCFAAADGYYLLDATPAMGSWSVPTSSQALNLPKVIAAGENIDVVAFGDSIAVTYLPGNEISDPNDPNLFPNILESYLDQIAESSSSNIAVSGSKSVEWLEGSAYFEARLRPLLANADVVVFTLGGNDLEDFFLANSNDANALLRGIIPEVQKIERNVRAIVDSIRLANPDVDIIWQIYPNYGKLSGWMQLAGSFASDLPQALSTLLSDIRRRMANYNGLLVWDIFGATSGEDINPLFVDLLHPNAQGHVRYAKELFYVLGGVEVRGGFVVDAAAKASRPQPKSHNIGFHQE